MYVEAGARGKGLGRRLLERMIAFARSRRLTRMELETSSVMHAAIGLYTASGFERVEGAARAQGCDQVLARTL